jgi:endonuclease/exonuclease/phosphatase (EEP) superfamily protein YafD
MTAIQRRPKSSTSFDSITILLWNVWLLPPPLSDTIVRSRASQISPLLANYDIVILNEAFTHKSRLLSQTTYPYKVNLGRKSCFDLLDSGIIILSAHPVVKSEMEHFRTRSKWDRLASKGIIFCRIRLPSGKEIDVYGTHMQAGHSNSEQTSRNEQGHQLAEFILRHSGEDGRNVVLAGDMNMGPSRNPDLQGYSVHYSSMLDAQHRVGTYEMIKNTANVVDVVCPGWEQDINRFLVRNIEDVEVEYLEKPRYDQSRYLSDSERLVCRISLPRPS